MRSGNAALLLELLRVRGIRAGVDGGAAWRAVSADPGLPGLLRLEGAELWLYRRIASEGLPLDCAAGQALRQAAHRDALRCMRVDEETEAVSRALTEARIPFALIKGPARRAAARLYPYADARSTSDVDLLLPEAEAPRAHALLQAKGYQPATDPADAPADHFHLVPLWNARRVAVEMHTSTSPWLAPSEAWRRETEQADTVEWAGQTLQIGRATELLWHAMVHAFIDGPGGLRLRAFLDGAVILASDRPVDWSEITRRIVSAEIRNPETGCAIPPRMLYRWIATSAELAGVEQRAEFATVGPFPLVRLLHWRSPLLRRASGRAARGRLLEEASRSVLGMGITPSPPGTATWPRVRRHAASCAARLAYLGWTALFRSRQLVHDTRRA